MSDLVQLHLHRDKNEIPEKCTQPYQCTWMARWTRASCGSASAAHNEISLQHESTDENHCTKHHLSIAGPERVFREFRDVSKGKMIAFVDESLGTSCGKGRDDAFEGPASVMLKLPRNTESILAMEKGECSKRGQYLPAGGIQKHASSLFALASSDAERQSREFGLQTEGISLTAELQMKSGKLFGKNTLPGLLYSQGDHVGSISKFVPYKSNGRTPMHPFFSYRGMNQSGAALVAHQKKADTGATLLVHDPSIDTDQLRDFIGRPFEEKFNHSEVELFPSQMMSPPNTRNLKSPHNGSYAPTRIPSSVHDVETMRICTTIDSVEEYLKVPQKVSQTTHQFFFTRKTDVKLFDGGQLVRESILAASEGKKVNEFPCLSPGFTFHIKQGLKLQPLGSFIESAKKEDDEHFKISTHDLKNELSVEADAMDMAVVQKNQLFGVASSQSNKDIKGGQKPLTSEAAVASTGGEIRGKHLDTEIPDMNQDIPIFPGLMSSKNDMETSTSRTQSLDVEHFLSHAEHPPNLKAGDGSDGSLKLDPCSRWIKRLKSSASDSFARGTKSSRMEEPSSHEKISKLFSKVLKCTKTTPEQKMSESNHKDKMAVDPTADELRKAEFTSIDSGKKSEDAKLLHAWIQRWCYSPAACPEQKSEMVTASKPHRSKSILHEIQKKQFPSLAAVALMGKVMTGFYPLEVRKRGSSVVWNTQKY